MGLKHIPILTALLAILVFVLPQTAHAASATQLLDCTSGSADVKAIQNNLTAAAQAKTNAEMQIPANTPPVDLQANYCWSKIDQAFQNLPSGVEGILSVLNPMNMIAGMINSAINSILNQLCQSAINMVNQFGSSMGSSISNLLCLPIPAFNLNLGLNSGLPSGSKACNGVSLLSMQAMTAQGNAPPAPGAWQLWSH